MTKFDLGATLGEKPLPAKREKTHAKVEELVADATMAKHLNSGWTSYYPSASPITQVPVATTAGQVLGWGTIDAGRLCGAYLQVVQENGQQMLYALQGIPMGKKISIEWVAKEV